MSYNPLINRDMGSFELSIATSLALEGLSGTHPDIISENKSDYFPLYLVNLRTLVRNIYQAVSSSEQLKISVKDMVRILESEIDMFKDTIKQLAPNSRVEFYHCRYHGIPRLFPDAHIRGISTPKQIHYHEVENGATARVIDNIKNHTEVKDYNVQITDTFETTAIFTHLPVDLLWRYQFSEIHLLESHTGRLKRHPEWYTKLTGGSNLQRIPFCRFSLQLFGDKGNFFAPFNIKIREEVLKIADKDKWTSITTNEKIKYSIGKIYDPIVKERLLSLI